MTISRSLLVVVALTLFCFKLQAQIISSDFASNVDGWSAPNALGATLNYSAMGGNPNGYVYAQTPQSIPVGAGLLWYPYYLNAPGKFLGNRSAYYGGGIAYDLSQTTTGTATALVATAVMTNAAGVSIYFWPNTLFQPPSFGTWQKFEIPFSAATGEWKTTDASTATPATAAQIQTVLAGITSLQIQGLYQNANVVTRFDNINMYPPLTIPTQPTSTSICIGSTGTFTAVGGNNPTITYQWQFNTPAAGWFNLTNSAIFNNVTGSILSITPPSTAVAGPYRCVVSGVGVADLISNVVTLTVNATPAAPTTTGASRCGTGSVTLTAAGGTAGSYRWYTVPTGGTSIGGQTNATYATPSLTTTTDFYVAINNGLCESTRTIVTATINNTTPPTTTGAARCGTGTVTLTATGGTTGQYRWYTVSTGGTADATQHNGSYTTASITTTTNFYVSIDNGTCESTRTLVVATINTVPAAPGVTGGSRCGTGTVVLTATGGTAGQYRWYTVPTGGTADATQMNGTYTTPSITGTTNYYVAINNGSCEGARTTVVATVNTIPTAPGVTGGARCGTGTVTLTATGGSAGQYRWYTVPTGGTADATQMNGTYTTASITGTTNFYVSIDDGTCESARTTVVATVNTIPTAPTTTGAARCGTGSVTVTAAGGVAGQYRWYTLPTGGTVIVGETNATYLTPSLTTTTNYYVSIDNGTCQSSRTLVVATISTPPTAPGVTGGSRCGTGTVSLSATGASAGQYRWYTVPTGGTADGAQTNATYTTPSITTTTNFYVSIDNGTCQSTRTTVVATVNTPPAAPGVTGGSRCGTGTVALTATGGAAGQYRWYTVPTGGTADGAQTNATYTTPSITTTTNFYVSIDNGTCQSTRTTVVATVNTPPAAPGVTGGSRCGTGTVALTATGGAAGQYRWYTVPTGGTADGAQTNATYTTASITTTTSFYVSINNGTCEGARTTVVATVNTPPTAPGVNTNARCGTGTVALTATGGSAGQYRWYTVPTGGTADGVQTNSTYTTASISSTTNFYVAINNGTCESTRTTAVATVNTIPNAPSVVGGGGCIPASVTLTASNGSAGQYRWYTVATGGTAISGEFNSTYATPTLSVTTTYYVSINNGLCEGPRAAVNATLNNPPAAPTANGGSACSPGAATLTASGGAAGEYRWYTVPTGGTAISGESNSSYVTPALTTTTTYYVALNNGCEGPRTSVVATLNTSPSAPTATGDFSCVPASITLTASGGSAGQYRWYNTSTGGTAINGEVNSTFATPVISQTTTYFVAITDGTCESTRTSVNATIGGPTCANNTPPSIEPKQVETIVGGKITIHLPDLIKDNENNLDLSTLTIVTQPLSGASATIDGDFDLVIDYSGKPFRGTESITISVCDTFGACSEKTFSIEVIASINVYNAVSPNKDGKNDLFIIDGIDQLEDTKVNHVAIFNRWGDLVWEGDNYNNTSVVFAGLSKNNAELPTGTYFYRIEFPASGRKTESGYLTMKR